MYRDIHGNILSHNELTKLLKKNNSPQYQWWHAKHQPRVDPDSPGQGRPPPGVRTNKEIWAMRSGK